MGERGAPPGAPAPTAPSADPTEAQVAPEGASSEGASSEGASSALGLARRRVEPSGERLVANLVHFTRLLRRAGLALGPGATLDAQRAAAVVDVFSRDELYWALHAVLVHRASEHDLFDAAFRLFWRDPMGAASALSLLLPQMRTPTTRTISRRLSEAWRPPSPSAKATPPPAPPAVDLFLAASAEETLRQRDFDQMSAEELAAARRLVRELTLGVPPAPSRRSRAAAKGRLPDRAGTVRRALRRGGELVELQRRRRLPRPLTIVALCDISGSMGRYSEMLLRFLHAALAELGRGHVFLFATRLSNVTRALRHRDVDQALARCGREVSDWASGTRLGASLREFNRTWARRVLAQGAVVLLVTDGLECEDAGELALEAARLRRSCRRLIWLNPLLRYAGFEPRATGVRALLPNVDEHRPVHDLDSLAALARALAKPAPRR
ncbi:MAG: VWA domain-containing protein [Myxococcales bacterium]|nr:VWA domain-containing protein [Myxococcales bacterium]